MQLKLTSITTRENNLAEQNIAQAASHVEMLNLSLKLSGNTKSLSKRVDVYLYQAEKNKRELQM